MVAASSVIGRPVTESTRGLFHSKPQAPTHILDLTTLVLNNLVNILLNIRDIQRRHTQELDTVIKALKVVEKHLIH